MSRLSVALMLLPRGQLVHLVVFDSTLELPSFLFGSDPTKCRQWSSEISLHVDKISSASCGNFVGGTSLMQISRSTILNPSTLVTHGPSGSSQLFSWRKYSSAAKCAVTIRRWTAALKEWAWSLKTQVLSVNTQPNCQGMACMLSVQAPVWSVSKTWWFYVVDSNLRPFCPLVSADVVTHPARRQFPTFPSNFGEPLQIVASASCSRLTGEAPGLALWWFGSATLRFWHVVWCKLLFMTVFCIPWFFFFSSSGLCVTWNQLCLYPQPFHSDNCCSLGIVFSWHYSLGLYWGQSPKSLSVSWTF